ncbi:MAG TPA: hypothetical protein VL361_05730 [Candidatus Limnocylindrales bacterium]|jgi:hypothetical protein|nr:hypothetical protein [Candidatus Limnocylindrales bacterium]
MKHILFPLAFACSLSAQPHPDLNYSQWPNGPASETSFFPIAVWLQSPANAARYRVAGFNTYIALWHGPTEAQLSELRKAGMRLICEQNRVALDHLADPTIIGWMHGDEPDNAQSLGDGKGYGPPVAPEKIVKDYERLRTADPSRPVMLNLGQGVAWDGWYGRGSRSRHPEDYPLYLKGCDIVSFDIYPAVHDSPEVAGKLWFVAQGVERLVRWSEGKKIVWNCVECTRISNPDRKPTLHEVRSEVWMSLIHGSRGLIYFVHQFKPSFREAALLDDSEMLEGITALNRQITRLAPVLNGPSVNDAITLRPENSTVPVAFTVRHHEGATWIFAVSMREGETTAEFSLKDEIDSKSVEVLDENRSIPIQARGFKDRFGSWDVHLYRLK